MMHGQKNIKSWYKAVSRMRKKKKNFMTDSLQAKIRYQDFLHIISDSAKHYDAILSQQLPFPAYYVWGVSNLQRFMSCEQQYT
jgi:hypothetical protein